jgi:hypothetical protein
MPKTLEELAKMIAARDGISYEEAMSAIHDCAEQMEWAFMNGSLDAAEDALRVELGLEPDYMDLFIF